VARRPPRILATGNALLKFVPTLVLDCGTRRGYKYAFPSLLLVLGERESTCAPDGKLTGKNIPSSASPP
jgi:hypothetical protein